VPYWCAAQLESNRVALATHHLKLSGYRIYVPRIRTYRISHGGRRVAEQPLLFPSYCFVWIELQWHRARWCCGVIRLIMAGDTTPARVPDGVIADLKGRETGGLIDLPPPPRFRPGDRLRTSTARSPGTSACTRA
jgi:transcription antitermination factor NusG